MAGTSSNKPVGRSLDHHAVPAQGPGSHQLGLESERNLAPAGPPLGSGGAPSHSSVSHDQAGVRQSRSSAKGDKDKEKVSNRDKSSSKDKSNKTNSKSSLPSLSDYMSKASSTMAPSKTTTVFTPSSAAVAYTPSTASVANTPSTAAGTNNQSTAAVTNTVYSQQPAMATGDPPSHQAALLQIARLLQQNVQPQLAPQAPLQLDYPAQGPPTGQDQALHSQNQGPPHAQAQGLPWGTQQPYQYPFGFWPQPQIQNDQLTSLVSKFDEIIKLRTNSGEKPPSKHESEEEEEEDSEEETSSVVRWTGGEKIAKKKESISLSETGREVFLGLTGRDKNLDNYPRAFKQPPDVSRKMRFFTSNQENQLFVQQDMDTVIPPLSNWKKTNDDALRRKGNLFGAGAAGMVSAVDTLQKCRTGLFEYAHEFENDDTIENVRAEAAKVCRDVSALLEQDLLGDLMSAMKINAVGFMEVTNERRSLALSQFKDQDIKRLIADVPPNERYLFGGQIQQAAQQLRDANLLSRSFVDPSARNKSHGSKPPYSKKQN